MIELTSWYGSTLVLQVWHWVVWIWLSTVHVQDEVQVRPHDLEVHLNDPNHLLLHSSSLGDTHPRHRLHFCSMFISDGFTTRFHSRLQQLKIARFIISLSLFLSGIFLLNFFPAIFYLDFILEIPSIALPYKLCRILLKDEFHTVRKMNHFQNE